MESAAVVAAAVIAAGGLFWTPAARAENLQDAWRLALASDKALAAVSSEAEGARAAERAARGARWPSLDANAGYTRLDSSPILDVVTPALAFRSGPIFKDDQFFSASVQMRLPLYSGGQIAAGIDATHQTALEAAADQQSAAIALRLEVAEAYVAVLRARQALEVARLSVHSLAAHAGDVEQMVERELVTRSDLLAARVALSNAEQTRVRADSSAEISQAAYNRRVGEPLERQVELDSRISTDAALSSQSLETLVRRAFDTRSELKAQAARADALASQSRAESGKALPQLALVGGYTHFDNQILDRQNFSTIGVGVTWNVFDGGQARNRAAALKSSARAAQSRLEDVRSKIELQVRQAWLDVRDAQARVKASSEAVAQADENLRTSRELYGVGLATNTQVLDAVTLQAGAARNHNEASLDLSLSLIRLEYAVGAL